MRRTQSLEQDDRAIEGLPIRLVIALVVGVAALGVMMSVLGDFGDVGAQEMTYEPSDLEEDMVYNIEAVERSDGDFEQEVRIIDDQGNEVPEASLVIRPDSAYMAEPLYFDDEDGDALIEITISDENIDLRRDRFKGELKVELVPPENSQWEDQEDNPPVTVIRANDAEDGGSQDGGS